MPTNNIPAFISQNQSGFPPYLDFKSMRSEAIGHLGPITSAYWTDYNEHDPGITILEALLYALMDLGYRVNWPIQDLLTQKSGLSETDFLTPAEVLGSNPFTINDYRKLLMDLTEVRNAWLQVSADTTTVNGLYEVLLELEKDVTDFATTEEWKKYHDDAVVDVKKVLQAHRNLCEDFHEPVVMSKQLYTVSADIELSAGASIPEVYQVLIKSLYNFFAPTPTYYTLPQLIAKGVSLDQVFAGRPFGKRPSHGFLLDSELPTLPGDGTPAIYPSAVLNTLLQVEGVEAVNNLNIQRVPPADHDASVAASSTGIGTEIWILQLDRYVLPVLSVAGSNFRWFLNGQRLSWTPGTSPAQLQKMLAYSGKVILDAGYPLLDNRVPQGTYLDGLDKYYSIQKDFPEVYGIGPGALPPSASSKRSAQAWQLKGYLLFFEQLMADFLAQLANIRSLLSMSGGAVVVTPETDEDDDPEDKDGWGAEIDPAGPGSGGGSGLYVPVAGDLSDVPGLDILLQFPGGDAADSNDSNVMLAFPVDGHQWHELVRKGPVTCEQVDRLKPYIFSSFHERDLAVAELLISFAVMSPTPVAEVLAGGKKQVFVISGVRSDFVLLSKSILDIGSDAVAAGRTAIFAGTSKGFYFPSVLTEGGKVGYSFSIGQSNLSYKNYVGQLLSNPEQSVQQRTGYLLHLIDRFAESYTDYAKLSATFLSAQDISNRQVGSMQTFLTNLPMLGSDRGKGYNYTRESWDKTNVSGLELRFKAYCGIGDWRRHYLCNFEVGAAEKQFLLHAALGNEAMMSSMGSFTEAEGYDAASELYKRMRSEANYRFVQDKAQYRFVIDLSSGDVAESVMSWPDKTEAVAAVKQLVRMISLKPAEEDIYPDKIEYVAEVVNAAGVVVRVGRQAYSDEAMAYEDAGRKIHDIREEKYWNIPAGMEHVPGRLERHREAASHLYMDTKGIEMPIKHDIPHKPEHCRYVVVDESGAFSFAGSGQYPTATAGRAAARVFLFLLIDPRNYVIESEAVTGRYRVAIMLDGKVEATESVWFAGEAEALARRDRIIAVLRPRLYTMRMAYTAESWKFRVHLGLPGTSGYVFESSKSYPSAEAALAAAGAFYQSDTGWELRREKNGVLLEKSGGVGGAESCVLLGAPSEELENLVIARSAVLALEQGNRETFGSWLQADERFREGGYVYRLVDKDRPRAFHAMAPGAVGEAGLREAETARAELMRRGRMGYLYPEFCLGGDNVISRIDESGAVVYHYCIRCRNDYFHRLGLAGHDKEWIIFESIAGYPSEDAAQQAFQENYLLVVEKAMERVNFGEKDFIAWDEHGRRHAVVYVNEELRRALEEAGLNVAEELVKAARAYPIRRILREKKKPRYFFALGGTDWVSAGRFDSAQDAHTAFDYFRLLLVRGQNYFIEYDEEGCRYRVGIREVLAESNGSFASEDDAWGKDGIQRFIGVAQASGGWHPQKKGECYWGYFVACPNEKAVHPCTYESERQRDEALERLYAAAQGTPAVKMFDDEASGPTEELLNRILDRLDAVWAGHDDEQRDDLLQYGAYFPIVRTKVIGAATEYRLEVKLPGFAALPGVVFIDADCGCPPTDQPGSPTCYAAWIGNRVYGTAMEVWNVYQALLPLLGDKNNYRPVHDEAALSYGIELLEEDGILARSIQPYFYAKMAARALDRAKECVNTEGLHLVEHVLLKPDARPGQRGATGPTGEQDARIPVCASGDNPTLPFPVGVDAYSFVMTVFLPAWPQRFREKKNRQLLESIVQRECPAHILPRIIWLTPKDMCRVETSYKKWLHWLHTNKRCGDFQPGELIKLLFSTSFDCMWYAGCDPETKKEKGDEWLSEINKLYCWADSECANTSGWTTGAGSAGNKDKKPFTMSGTQLKRPGLTTATPENKPVKVRQKPTVYRRGVVIDDSMGPVNGKSRGFWLWFMVFIRKVMQDSGRLIRRIGPIRRKS